ELEKKTDPLAAFQQLLAARARVLDEREETKRELLAALGDLEKAAACNGTLAEARQLSLRLTATASDLKKRVGKGELAGDKVPDGVTEAFRVGPRAKREAQTGGVLTALAQVEQERKALRRPDADALRAATKDLLALVGQRLDLLADLKKLTAEYQRGRKDRPESEVKRLD